MNLNIKIKNLDKLMRSMDVFPSILKNEIKVAIQKSIAQIERESKPITPVDTGLLRSSIRADYLETFKGAISPHTSYAVYVHENLSAHHNIGEAQFMTKGADRAEPTIKRLFETAIDQAIVKSF